MKKFIVVVAMLGWVDLGNCFTKYGRTCKDIGCPSTQECVMQTDPCSYYQRQGECGSYPTCKRSTTAKRTCTNFVCPPSQVCRMDGDTPKCSNDASKSGLTTYDTQAINDNNAPNAPPAENSGQIYPTIPKGETTPRPNVRPAYPGGSGYQGGQIGSGYPGQSGHSGGYPQQGGYPQGGYHQGGYQGYPQGYPQGGYQGYPQGNYQYPGYQNNYNPYHQQQYPQKSSGSSITDKISEGLKKIGTDLLKNYLIKSITGGGNRN